MKTPAMIDAGIGVAIVALCFFVFYKTFWAGYVQHLKQKGGTIPENPTLFDVRRLLISGKKHLAIQVYAKIFKVGHKEASKAVLEIEKNLKSQNKDLPN